MSPRLSLGRKALVTGALVLGVGFGAAGVASAATSSSTNSSTPVAANPQAPPSGSQGNPATMTHGPNETLLTGADLQKAEAAAKAAVPGATIIRAETDSSGASKYEVHMQKSDGTYVTVELDANFNAVKTISGFGAGPAGAQPPTGVAPPSSGASGASGASA
jgi:hypothetical protein